MSSLSPKIEIYNIAISISIIFNATVARNKIENIVATLRNFFLSSSTTTLRLEGEINSEVTNKIIDVTANKILNSPISMGNIM